MKNKQPLVGFLGVLNLRLLPLAFSVAVTVPVVSLALPPPDSVFTVVMTTPSTHPDFPDYTWTLHFVYRGVGDLWDCIESPMYVLHPAGPPFGPWVYENLFLGGPAHQGGTADSPAGAWHSIYYSEYGFCYGGGSSPFRRSYDPCKEYAKTREPINVINGAVTFSQTDVSIWCPGMPLHFARHYNSQSHHAGALGAGWTHSFDIRLTATNVIEYGETNSYQVLHRGNHEDLWFLSDGSDGFASPFSELWQLQALSNGGYCAISPECATLDFDSNGTCRALMDMNGNGIALSYTNAYPNERPVRIEHSNGRALDLTYTEGHLAWVAVDAGLGVEFAYSAEGDLTNATRVAGDATAVTTYRYAAHANSPYHSITQVVNAAGESFSYVYETNSIGQATGLGIGMALDQLYYKHAVDYGASNDLETVVTYERGDTNQTYRYRFSHTDEIEDIYGPTGTNEHLHLERDNLGYVVGATMEDHSATGALFWAYGRDGCHNITNAAFGYGMAPTNEWLFTWDTNVQVITAIVDPEGARVEFSYTNDLVCNARVYGETGAVFTTTYGYASNGLLTAVTNANGHWVRYEYDQYGGLTSAVPQAGVATAWELDSLGRVSGIYGGTREQATCLARDALGQVTNITFADGCTAQLAYDAQGSVVEIVDTAGRTNRFTYAVTGRPLGTLRQTADGWVTNSVTYDPQMNELSVRDELGRVVEAYALDLQDRPISVTNLEGQVMSITRGVEAYICGIRRFDQTDVGYLYNTDGLLRRMDFPGTASAFSYLRNGLLSIASNAVGTISNTYDAANRLIAQECASPSGTVSYSYLPAGNCASMTCVSGTLAYNYDAAERLTAIDGPLAACGYTYNTNNGLAATLCFSNTALSATFQYDVMDRVTNIVWQATGAVLHSFAYDYNAVGMVTDCRMATGEDLTYVYDDLDRLMGVTRRDTRTGEVIDAVTNAYDLAGNRLSRTSDGLAVACTNQYNRLMGWTATFLGREAWARIDVAGHADEAIGTNSSLGALWVSNIVARIPRVEGTNFIAYGVPVAAGVQNVVAAIGDAAGSVGYATNTLTVRVVTNATYSYNLAGCLTNVACSGVGVTSTLRLVWNGEYRLTAAETNGAVAETYAYDALGRRACTVSGGATNWCVWDGAHVVAEVDPDGHPRKSYMWGPGIDNLLAFTVYGEESTNTYYCLTDHLGSVHALADSAGQIVESYRYDAWGRVLGVYDGNGTPLEASAIGNRYLWQGREYSWTTGLYYFRARWYDPVTGRWLSKDPIGISGGLNQYVFCGNNPVNCRDPYGLSSTTLVLDSDPAPGKVARAYTALFFHHVHTDVGSADAAISLLESTIAATGSKITRLNMVGHGFSAGVAFGHGETGFSWDSLSASQRLRLGNVMAPEATIYFFACQSAETAKERATIQAMANSLNVNVVAPGHNVRPRVEAWWTARAMVNAGHWIAGLFSEHVSKGWQEFTPEKCE